MPRNIIHSDVSMDPESASEALSASPEEEEQDMELEEEEEEEGEEEVEPEEVEEEEEQVDIEDTAPQDASDLDELSSPSASPPPTTKSPSRTRLKITLKLPTQKPKRGRGRALPSPTPDASRQVSRDIDIESEDEDDDETAGGSGRPMTTRQAVLASVVDSSHVSLNETSRKKKQLNEAELALRREETARKRKHLSEKKLEDEKAETINRLLKKQSRARGKRNALSTADDRTPATQTGAATPVEGEDQDMAVESSVPAYEVIPTLYRWVSTSRPAPADGSVLDGEEKKDEERKMTLSFSVPLIGLPAPPEEDDTAKMDVDEPNLPVPPVRVILECDVEGCTSKRKYRLVRDWERGACGMDHLKVLERQPESMTV